LHIDTLTGINYSVSNSRILSLRYFMSRKSLFIDSIRLVNSLARRLSSQGEDKRRARNGIAIRQSARGRVRMSSRAFSLYAG
jgi:hypothetical protein